MNVRPADKERLKGIQAYVKLEKLILPPSERTILGSVISLLALHEQLSYTFQPCYIYRRDIF